MEKRFDPSRKRLQKARKEGNLSKSQYLSQIAGLMAGIITLFYLIEISWVDNKILLEYLWGEGFKDPVAACQLVLGRLVSFLFCLLAPFVVGGLAAELWQVGFSIEGSLLLPAFKRVDPASGTKKIFQGFREIWLISLKLIALLLVFYWFFNGVIASVYREAMVNPVIGGSFVERNIWRAAWYGLLVLTSLAGLDYFIRRKRWFQQVGMSLQDLRDEHKEEEGDPMVKGARRAQHEALLHEDLKTRVRQSRVIIVEKNVVSKRT